MDWIDNDLSLKSCPVRCINIARFLVINLVRWLRRSQNPIANLNNECTGTCATGMVSFLRNKLFVSVKYNCGKGDRLLIVYHFFIATRFYFWTLSLTCRLLDSNETCFILTTTCKKRPGNLATRLAHDVLPWLSEVFWIFVLGLLDTEVLFCLKPHPYIHMFSRCLNGHIRAAILDVVVHLHGFSFYSQFCQVASASIDDANRGPIK